MDTLSTVVPFFGLMMCITTGWGIFLSRRIRRLENRVELVEERPLTQVIVPAPRPPYTLPPMDYSNPGGVTELRSNQMQ